MLCLQPLQGRGFTGERFSNEASSDKRFGELWGSGWWFGGINHIEETIDHMGEDRVGRLGKVVNEIIRRVPLIMTVL